MSRTLEELREYLVLEMKFDNNFLDSSGNNNTGIPTDIEWKPTSRGLKPNGSDNSQISVGLAPILRAIQDKPFTISCWVASEKTGINKILTVRNAYSRYLNVLVHYGVPVLITRNGDYSQLYSDTKLDNRFHHLVFVRQNDGTLQIYIDGVLDCETKKPLLDIGGYEYTPVRIGAIYEYNGGVLNTGFDIIGDVSFYLDTYLSADEVLNLYNSTKHNVGVRPAERSYTHRLQPEVDENTVVAFDMHTRNSDGTLRDLS